MIFNFIIKTIKTYYNPFEIWQEASIYFLKDQIMSAGQVLPGITSALLMGHKLIREGTLSIGIT